MNEIEPPKNCIPEWQSVDEDIVPFYTSNHEEMESADSWMGQCLQRVLHHVRRQNARVENHLILWYNMSIKSEFINSVNGKAKDLSIISNICILK